MRLSVNDKTYIFGVGCCNMHAFWVSELCAFVSVLRNYSVKLFTPISFQGFQQSVLKRCNEKNINYPSLKR